MTNDESIRYFSSFGFGHSSFIIIYMRTYSLVFIYILTLIISCSLCPVYSHAFEVRISSSTIQPGDTVCIILQETKKRGAYLVWFNGREYPLYKTGKRRLRTLIGTPCDFSPGDYSILVVGTEKKGKLSNRGIELIVREKKYPSRMIAFTPEKESLIYSPESKVERESIRETLNIESEEQYWQGLFLMPVDSKIVSEYGVRRMMHGRYLWSHKGIDLRGDIGTVIVASNRGKVRLARDNFCLHGGTLVIDHGQGVSTVYFHLNEIYVKEGDLVEKESLIGEIGDTGLTTGPHLHWGLFVHDIPVQPLQWLEEWIPQ